MKKYLLSTVISRATLLLATTANARSSYDGSWSLVFFTQRGVCDSTYNFSVNINDGVLTHPNLVKFRGYTDMTRAIPKFQLDDDGVRRFVPSSTSALSISPAGTLQIAKSESIVSGNFYQGASGASPAPSAQKRSAGSIRLRAPPATL
jgi:hypothetical protein